jgi:hypothetical protein
LKYRINKFALKTWAAGPSEMAVSYHTTRHHNPEEFVIINFIVNFLENFVLLYIFTYVESEKSRDSSVGIVLGYGLDDRGARIRFPVGAGNFSLHLRIQNGSGAHPASYPMGSRGSFPGDKAAGV